jgi:hypothetical protein
VTAAVILGVNAWLVWHADKSWGFWLWAFFLIPAANALLTGALVACSPLVRLVSGASAGLHVRVTLLGCLLAVIIDAAIIIHLLHGC